MTGDCIITNGYASKHEQIRDRGEQFRRGSRRSSLKASNSNRSPPAESRTLYSILWSARLPHTNNNNNRFIPFDQLEWAKNRRLVEKSLKKDGFPQAEIPALLDTICADHPVQSGNSFFRIFAILVLCENVGCISNFIDQCVDDSYLPLPVVERDEGRLTIVPHKHGRNISLEKLENLFQDRRDWRQASLNDFNTYQWWVIAPFFDRPDSVIPHYILEANDVLPITDRKSHLEYEVGSLDPDVKEVVLRGGFGDVFIVKLHPSHYSFGDQPYSDGSHSFALKRLKSSSHAEFKLEVDALRKYNYGIDKHLIPLLATIEKEDEAGKYYLLFPKANGDLRYFWKTQSNPHPDESLVRWMAEQFLGIAKALSMLHKDQDPDKGEDYPIYGRHGDIKAANILWFTKPNAPGRSGWRLVLSDFGLMRFHRAISISAQTANKLKKTLTYQAPEFDMPGAKISRKSDIWALGCTFLEFVTWYLCGYKAVEDEFPSQRGEDDKDLPRVSEDKFYRMNEDGKSAELKRGVRDRISELHRNLNCSKYLDGLLDFIEQRMLRIERDKRPSAAEVAAYLETLLKQLPNDSYHNGQAVGRKDGKL
ncbi:kinase-like protein [Hypomontagnella submonticulosa]|nr:kinase-like protein [Hypomontagnella submonticulosa]